MEDAPEGILETCGNNWKSWKMLSMLGACSWTRYICRAMLFPSASALLRKMIERGCAGTSKTNGRAQATPYPPRPWPQFVSPKFPSCTCFFFQLYTGIEPCMRWGNACWRCRVSVSHRWWSPNPATSNYFLGAPLSTRCYLFYIKPFIFNTN